MLMGFLLAMHSVEQRVFPSAAPGTKVAELGLAPAAQSNDLLGLAMTPETGPLVSAR
jgi:hypothetical protein